MSSLQSILVSLPKARQSLGISAPTRHLLIEQNRARTGGISKRPRVSREPLAFHPCRIADNTPPVSSSNLFGSYFRGVPA